MDSQASVLGKETKEEKLPAVGEGQVRSYFKEPLWVHGARWAAAKGDQQPQGSKSRRQKPANFFSTGVCVSFSREHKYLCVHCLCFFETSLLWMGIVEELWYRYILSFQTYVLMLTKHKRRHHYLMQKLHCSVRAVSVSGVICCDFLNMVIFR